MFRFFKRLPDELTVKVISNLNDNERMIVANTCRKLYSCKNELDKIDGMIYTTVINLIFSTSKSKTEILIKRLETCFERGGSPDAKDHSASRMQRIICLVAEYGSINSPGSFAAARILLKHGATLNSSQPNPIYIAALSGNARMAKLLIDAGSLGFVGREKDGDVKYYPHLYNAIMTGNNWEAAYEEEISTGLGYSRHRSYAPKNY